MIWNNIYKNLVKKIGGKNIFERKKIDVKIFFEFVDPPSGLGPKLGNSFLNKYPFSSWLFKEVGSHFFINFICLQNLSGIFSHGGITVDPVPIPPTVIRA